MTHFYGSSNKTKLVQMRSFIKSIEAKNLLRYKTAFILCYLKYIIRSLVYYINTYYPEAMLLYKIIAKMADKKHLIF
jgi:hypothetical protein